MHSVKSFEWNKYANSNLDVPEFLPEYYNAPGSRKLDEYFDSRPDLNTETLNRIEPDPLENLKTNPDVDPLAPYFYDQPTVDRIQKILDVFEKHGLDYQFVRSPSLPPSLSLESLSNLSLSNCILISLPPYSKKLI